MTDQACEHVPPCCRVALSTLRLLDSIDNPAWLVPMETHQQKPGRTLNAEETALRQDAIACLSSYLREETPIMIEVGHLTPIEESAVCVCGNPSGEILTTFPGRCADCRRVERGL